MQVTKLTIFHLFQLQKRHLVPLFQRPYVWNKDAQWTPLWENIHDKAEEIADYNAGLAFKNPSLHFLGAIVRSPFHAVGMQVAANLLIDGQQRLTTMQIVLLALRDYVKANPSYAAGTGGQSVLLQMMTDNPTALDPSHPEERYKVWPTNADRTAFLQVAEAGTPAALKAALPPQKLHYRKWVPPYPLLAQAYLFFYEKIAAYVEAEDDTATPTGQSDGVDTATVKAARLAALVQTLQNFMELVVIDLEGDEDPQVIFETLNARGAKLLPSDLVRNFVFWNATQKKEDADALHASFWAGYDADFWKQLQQQGRVNRPRIDLFLFHYLACQTRREVSITETFNEFRAWWQKEPRSVPAELQKMQQFSHIYHELITPTKDSRWSLFARRVRILDVGTLYPLLLFLKGEAAPASLVSHDDLNAIAVHLEAYLVRRMVCGLTTKRYNLIFSRLLHQLTESKTPCRFRLKP